MAECFYKEGLYFECRRCSGCCRLTPGYVYLSQRDLTSLCQWFKMREDEFIGRYCRWVQYYGAQEALCLRETSGYDCILWNGGCTAYGARPVQCSTYPFWTWILNDRETWREESKSCPGIDCGRHYSAEKITEQKQLYEHNIPLTR